MIELQIRTDSLDRLRRRYDEAPGIVYEQLLQGTVQAVNECVEEVRRLTPVSNLPRRAAGFGTRRLG